MRWASVRKDLKGGGGRSVRIGRSERAGGSIDEEGAAPHDAK